jgi:DNA-binding CsgD family transcriptional regulator
MARSASGTASSLGECSVSGETVGEPRELLSALFRSSTVGVAICDRQFRFHVINDALASMNGIPAAAHLGKTLHAVLGTAAAKVQPAFEHVFATGQPLSNFAVTAELPSRGAVGHWNASYFPIKDRAGQVQQVGAIVLELTKHNELEAALFRLTDKLARLTAVLRNDPDAPEFSGLGRGSVGFHDVFAGPTGLLESCLSETRAISQLLRDTPPLTAVQPLRLASISPVRHLRRGQGQEFAAVHPIEDELEYMSPLSSREREVVALLAIGRTNKEIATKLAISTRTVESHRARIMLKLSLHSLSDLVRYAVRIHLIEP